MLADPIEGFFAGLRSVFARGVLGLGAILAGFAVHFLVRGDISFWKFPPLLVGLIFWWGIFYPWFFVGLVSFVLMFAFLVAFVRERQPKLTFFATFTFALIYSSPLVFSHKRSGAVVCVYLLIALSYFVIPALPSRWRKESQ
jgi:hypothetical protein